VFFAFLQSIPVHTSLALSILKIPAQLVDVCFYEVYDKNRVILSNIKYRNPGWQAQLCEFVLVFVKKLVKNSSFISNVN
jgi:hypothetical protein